MIPMRKTIVSLLSIAMAGAIVMTIARAQQQTSRQRNRSLVVSRKLQLSLRGNWGRLPRKRRF